MNKFAVYNVVASSTGSHILLGDHEHNVAAYDLHNNVCSKIIKTTFDGDRLALSDEFSIIIAGAHHVHGLAAYSLDEGSEQWRRKDIKKVQSINLSSNGAVAYCEREDASLVVIDVQNGELQRTVRGAEAVYDSKYDDVKFVDAHKPYLLDSDMKRISYIEKTSFAILGAVFAPGLLFISESCGPIRCFDIASGKEQWRYNPEKGSHVLELGYHLERSSLLSIEWPKVRGGDYRLLRLTLEEGKILDSFPINEGGSCCFALDGQILAVARGQKGMEIINTGTGAVKAFIDLGDERT